MYVLASESEGSRHSPQETPDRFFERKRIVFGSLGTYSSVLPPLMPRAITEEQIEKGTSIIGEGLAQIA
jgi:hypothetical protein